MTKREICAALVAAHLALTDLLLSGKEVNAANVRKLAGMFGHDITNKENVEAIIGCIDFEKLNNLTEAK